MVILRLSTLLKLLCERKECSRVATNVQSVVYDDNNFITFLKSFGVTVWWPRPVDWTPKRQTYTSSSSRAKIGAVEECS